MRNTFQPVQKHKLQNPKNIVIGHLNVNSLRNKFNVAEELVQNKVDICLLSETKSDETFSNQQFVINGCKLFRRDRNCHGEDVLCYINENISSKTVNVEVIVKECEIVLIEFSIRSRKWLFIGLYKPPSQNEKNCLDNLSLIINRLTFQYENVMLIGNLNITIENKNLVEVFMNSFSLECLIKKPACFHSKNPSCIDLILTNKKNLFKNSNALEVGILDYRSLILTALKNQLVKGNAKTKLYRDYSEFNMDNFKAELDDKLKSDVVTEYSNFVQFLNNHAPAKKKNVLFNNSLFMTKTLRKAIMHRSRLKYIYIYISVKEMINIGESIKSKEIFVLTFSVKLKQNTLKI